MDLERIEALERLAELKRQGLLTDAEFEAEKNRVLLGEPAPVGDSPDEDEPHRPDVDQQAPPPEPPEKSEIDRQPSIAEEHNVEEQPLEPTEKDPQAASRGDTSEAPFTQTRLEDSQTTTAGTPSARSNKRQRALVGALALVAIVAISVVALTGRDSNPSSVNTIWSNSDKIVFNNFDAPWAERDSHDPELFMMNSDGTDVEQLTDSDTYPWSVGGSWSPDGRHIVFTSDRDGDSEIFLMAMDTISAGTGNPGVREGAVKQLTDNDDHDDWAVFSGNEIVFVSDRDGDYEIFVMTRYGSRVEQLTNNRWDDRAGVWSPDGNKIAFSSDRYGGHSIFMMDLVVGTNPDWSVRADGTSRLDQRGYPWDWGG